MNAVKNHKEIPEDQVRAKRYSADCITIRPVKMWKTVLKEKVKAKNACCILRSTIHELDDP